jgi:glycosyltransferase involved in cell wall biosynthesis
MISKDAPDRKPFISIVVPFHNARTTLPNLLESLFNQNYPKNMYEIILIDDGSTDGSSDIITEVMEKQQETCNVKTLKFKDRGGPARARNFGIKNSDGEIIAFTDADAIPDRNWLIELVKEFKDDSIGGVAGKVVTDSQKLLFPLRVSPIAEFVTCNIAYRKNVLLQVGLFDEKFKYPFREDSDLAYRILDQGYKIIYQNNAVVYHPVKQITLRDLLHFIKYHSYDVLLFKKHPKRARALLDIRLYRFTTNGITIILNVLIILWFFITAPIEWSMIYTLFYFVLITLALSIVKPSAKGKNLKDRIQGAIWHELYTLFTVVGHILGSIKFKKWLL